MNTLDTSAFIGKFVEEARDRLKGLTAAVLRLEEVPGAQDAMAEVLRQGHNLKGSARMLGLIDIAQVVHHLEGLFVAAQQDARRLDAVAFDVVLSTIDALSIRVEQLASGIGDAPDVSALCRTLSGLAAGPVRAAQDGAAAATPADRGIRAGAAGGRVRAAIAARPGGKTRRPDAPRGGAASSRASRPRSGTSSCGVWIPRSAGCAIARVRRASRPRPEHRSGIRRVCRSAGASQPAPASVLRRVQRRSGAPQPHHRRVPAERHQPDDAAAAARCSTPSRAPRAIWRGNSTRKSRSPSAAVRRSSTRRSSSRSRIR